MFKESFARFLIQEARSPEEYLKDRASKYYKIKRKTSGSLGNHLPTFVEDFPPSIFKTDSNGFILYNSISDSKNLEDFKNSIPEDKKDLISPYSDEFLNSVIESVHTYKEKIVKFFLDSCSKNKALSGIYRYSNYWDNRYEYYSLENVFKLLKEDVKFEDLLAMHFYNISNSSFDDMVDALSKNSKVDVFTDFIELSYLTSSRNFLFYGLVEKLLNKYNITSYQQLETELLAFNRLLRFLGENLEQFKEAIKNTKNFGRTIIPPTKILEEFVDEMKILGYISDDKLLSLLKETFLGLETKYSDFKIEDFCSDIWKASKELPEEYYDIYVGALKSLHKESKIEIDDISKAASNKSINNYQDLLRDLFVESYGDDISYLLENYFLYKEDGTECNPRFKDQLGHCGGDSNATDMYNIVKAFEIKGVSYLQSVATAAMKDNSLIQIHGIGNSKPSTDYYPAIYEFYKDYVSNIDFSEAHRSADCVTVYDLITYNPEWGDDLSDITEDEVSPKLEPYIIDDIFGLYADNSELDMFSFSCNSSYEDRGITSDFTALSEFSLPALFENIVEDEDFPSGEENSYITGNFYRYIKNESVYFDLDDGEDHVYHIVRSFFNDLNFQSIVDDFNYGPADYVRDSLNLIDSDSLGRSVRSIIDMGFDIECEFSKRNDMEFYFSFKYNDEGIKFAYLNENPSDIYYGKDRIPNLNREYFKYLNNVLSNEKDFILRKSLTKTGKPTFHYSSFQNKVDSIIRESKESEDLIKIKLEYKSGVKKSGLFIRFLIGPIPMYIDTPQEMDKEFKKVLRSAYIISSSEREMVERIIDVINSSVDPEDTDNPLNDKYLGRIVAIPTGEKMASTRRAYIDRGELIKNLK